MPLGTVCQPKTRRAEGVGAANGVDRQQTIHRWRRQRGGDRVVEVSLLGCIGAYGQFRARIQETRGAGCGRDGRRMEEGRFGEGKRGELAC